MVIAQGLFAILLLAPVLVAEHACEREVSEACPEVPGPEKAACLKDPSQHENPTVLSSECSDFVALNIACAEEIEVHCDEAFFSDDTHLCLSKWTLPENLSEKCAKAVAFAAEDTNEEGEEVTDELGMSEKDYEEKKEWQEKRKAARGDSIERLKMKEADRKKEEARVELEKFKREHPEEYEAQMEREREEARQVAEQKKRERMIQAAIERKKREAAGESEDEDAQKKQKKEKKQKKAAAAPETEGSPKLQALLAFGFIVGLLAIGYFLVMRTVETEEAKAKQKKEKKKK